MAKTKPRTGELTTVNYGWTKPTVGASDDAWGGYINADLDGIDNVVHGIQTSIPVVPSASATQPAMDGASTAGSSAQWSRGDHVHPTDTSRASVASVPVASSTTPAMNGTAAVGTGTTWARADHVHPSDTSKLSLSGGILTGALTPSQTAGIVGTTTNNSVNAGAVGEYVVSNKTTNVALTSTIITNITSISLTAGDWDVEGTVYVTFTNGGLNVNAAVSTVSATLPSATYLGWAFMAVLTASLSDIGLATGAVRVSVAATTTVYLVASGQFSAGTSAGQGSIRARRVR